MLQDSELHDDHAYLVKLAYRMLGSVSDAEEVAQEAFTRWYSAGAPEVDSLRAWLTRTATRLCLDRLKSSARKREQYIGDELPEPLLLDPGRQSEIDDTLSMALLAAIQRLTPSERAVFLLHDVFDYRFDEVAQVLELRPEHCRQLAVRARRSLRLDRVRSDPDPEAVDRLTHAFFHAIESGEVQQLEDLLSADVVFRSDGGGEVPATPKPIHGREAVIHFLERVLMRTEPSPVLHRRRVWFNGSPGTVLTDADGRPLTAIQFQIQDGRICGLFAQRNPRKLAGLQP